MPLSWPRGACRRTWLQARAASRNLSVPLKPRAPVYVRTMMVKNAQKKQRRRGPGRQFEPGQSGNPAGRPRGARNRATVLAEKLMQDDIEDVVRAVVDAAKERDMTAAKLVLERVAPRPKGRAVAFVLPEIRAPGDLVAAFDSLIAAMATGEITPDEAVVIASVLELKRKALETLEVRTGPLDELDPDDIRRLREALLREKARRLAAGDGEEVPAVSIKSVP